MISRLRKMSTIKHAEVSRVMRAMSRLVGKFVPVEAGTYSIIVQVALRW